MNDSEENKLMILELLQNVDLKNLDCLDQFYHTDYIEHNTESIKSQASGIEGVRYGFRMFIQAFENFSHTIDDILAEGDKVAVRITFSGLFSKPLFDHAPTNKIITATGIAIYRIADRKIKEKWGYFNALQFLNIYQTSKEVML